MENTIHVAIIGVGNCAGAFVEGIQYYCSRLNCSDGLLFPKLAGYDIKDIKVVAAFDISEHKVGSPLCEAIYADPNNFVQIENLSIDNPIKVCRGHTFDGNPEHLAMFVPESSNKAIDVPQVLKDSKTDVVVNLLPTGSNQASEFYAECAAIAGCAFVNCTPSLIAQNAHFQKLFEQHQVPLLGDDIKSQVGTTILHRAILRMLQLRGAQLISTSQINVGGNMDFVNFVHRAETKLISKRKSLNAYTHGAALHVDNIYDPTRGSYKTAYIEVDSTIFAGSKVHISIRLHSDDKPNSAGVICDLVRIAKAAMDKGISGIVPSGCAFYMKSPPYQMNDEEALEQLQTEWGCN